MKIAGSPSDPAIFMYADLLSLEPFPGFFAAWVFLLGAIVGSFLNVCIYRIPAGRSVVRPGSTCACGQPVAWHDNIPILSWLLLRGRTRCCGRPFSIRYPVIEALTAILFLFCWLQHPPARAAAGMVFVSLMIAAAFIDIDHMIIPDRFSIGGAIAGVTIACIVPSLHGADTGLYIVDGLRSGFDALIGLLIGSAVVLWIAILAETILRREAMGFGDVKLLGAIGAFCGWQGALFSIFGGAVLGCIAVGLGMLVGWRPATDENSPTEDPNGPRPDDGEAPLTGREIPFGPMLAAAGVLYFIWLHPSVDAWFANLVPLFDRSAIW